MLLWALFLKQVYEFFQLQGGLNVSLDFESSTGVGGKGSQLTLEHGQKVFITHTQCHVWLSAQGPNSSWTAPYRTQSSEGSWFLWHSL